MMLFPVKLARFGSFVGWAAASCAICSCGYHSAYLAEPRAERLTVGAASFTAPSLPAVEAALAGVRAELSQAGALQPGSGYPRLMVEVVRVDELAAGIQASGGLPLARGSNVGVTARAWVLEAPERPATRDTGDVRRVETVSQGSDVLMGSEAFSEATRAAARQVGRALARRVLGLAEPSLEPM